MFNTLAPMETSQHLPSPSPPCSLHVSVGPLINFQTQILNPTSLATWDITVLSHILSISQVNRFWNASNADISFVTEGAKTMHRTSDMSLPMRYPILPYF